MVLGFLNFRFERSKNQFAEVHRVSWHGMASLPSYQEATATADWLRLIAPYCRFVDYRALRLVNIHFHDVFSPFLWRDLFRAVRLSGLDQGDDFSWWLKFVYKKLGHFSKSSRGLVRILDARQFAENAYDFWSDQKTGTLSKAFERALTLLPNVNAILLDGHRDLDLAFLTVPNERRQYGNLQVLSVAACRYQIPRLFFVAPSLQNVVYLDISYLPGSLLSVVQPAVLPALRILKVRGRELNDSRCLELLGHLGLRLWSLDISDNNVTDNTIQAIKDWCVPTWPLRTEAHSHAEGKLLSVGGGTEFHGPFLSIEDGDLSASFSHPERYYVDAPRYMAQSTSATQENHVSRSDGSSGIRKDTVEAATALLTVGDGPVETTQDYRQSAGLTHLRLSNNQLSAVGVQKLLRISNGYIEDLTCDSLSLLPKDGPSGSFWPPNTNLRGILGAAHCFRPVMSPNLRVLRLHHSVVTNIPTLHMRGASYQARSHLAETIIRERIETLFPQTFLPDMNPRLLSLTLTCLPRRSCGPLISKLIQFLKLLSDQERAIQDISRTVSTRRNPRLLKGLRHLRLEFDHDDVMDDGFSASVDLVGEQLMKSEDEMFSFFRDERVETQISAMQTRSFANATLNSKGVAGESRSPRVDQSYFPDRDKSDFVTHNGRWNDEGFSVQVWIGPANPDAPEALRDYRRMVVKHDVKDGVGPVTPAQIEAGAPRSSFIYQIAWSAAVMPASLRLPEEDELAGMSDVLDALKAYRLESRSEYEQRRKVSTTQRNDVLLGNPHYFWTGTLEVSLEVKMPSSLRPTDWR